MGLSVAAVVVSALLVAGAIVWAARQVAAALERAGAEARRPRALDLLTLLGPAAAAGRSDPLALLAWHPVVRAVRTLFPEESASLDRAAGARFPFSAEIVNAAHARWTAEWLAWERIHDAEYKLKAAAAEDDLERSGGAPVARARLEAVEREKLDTYQRRYEEYIRVAKALQALVSS